MGAWERGTVGDDLVEFARPGCPPLLWRGGRGRQAWPRVVVGARHGRARRDMKARSHEARAFGGRVA